MPISFDEMYEQLGSTPSGVALADLEAPGFATTMRRTGGQMLGGIGEIYGDISGDRENALAKYAADVIARNPSGINSLADIADRPGLAMSEAAANALTFLIPYMGAGKVLQLLRAGPAASTAVQTALAGIPSLGEIGESQRKTDSENLALKYGGAAAVGAIENMFGLQKALAPLAGMPVRQMTEEAARRLTTGGVKEFAKEWGKIGLGEGLEETLQTPIEQFTGGKDVTSGESLGETVLSGAMGAIGGLVLGPLGAGAQRSQASKLVDQIDDARATLTSTPLTFDEIPQWQQEQQQALAFLKNIAENDFGLKQAEEMAAQATANQRSILDAAAERIAANENAKSQAAIDQVAAENAKAFEAQRTQERAKEREDQIKLFEAQAAERDAQGKALKTLMDIQKSMLEFTPTSQADVSHAEPQAPALLEQPVVEFAPVEIPKQRTMPTAQLRLPDVEYGGSFEQPIQPFEAQFDLNNINDQISLGQQIDMSLRHAQATGDNQTAQLLMSLGSQLMDRIATGRGTQPIHQMVAGRAGETAVPGTQQELFGTRGEPTYAAAPDMPAAPAVQPKPKSTKTTERRDAVVIDARTALAEGRITPEQFREVQQGAAATLPPKELRARLDDFLNQPKELQNGMQVEGQAPAQEVTPAQPAAQLAAASTQETADAQPTQTTKADQPVTEQAVKDRKTKKAKTTAAQKATVDEAATQVTGATDAVQKQTANEGVLRQEEPQVGLQEVVKGDAETEVTPEEAKAQGKITVEYDNGAETKSALARDAIADLDAKIQAYKKFIAKCGG